MRSFVLATSNPGKVDEIRRMLDGSVEVVPQSFFGVPEIPETGLTFVENALLKARNASGIANLPAIADDSGLEVDALGGAPGIYSSRYAGPGATDEANLQKLLAALEGIAPPRRTARFQCVMVYLRHAEDPAPLICQGTWEGAVASAPRGSSGFGYDPVFVVPGLNCTAAELDPETKNRLSHRGQALRALAAMLRSDERRGCI